MFTLRLTTLAYRCQKQLQPTLKSSEYLADVLISIQKIQLSVKTLITILTETDLFAV